VKEAAEGLSEAMPQMVDKARSEGAFLDSLGGVEGALGFVKKLFGKETLMLQNHKHLSRLSHSFDFTQSYLITKRRSLSYKSPRSFRSRNLGYWEGPPLYMA
jgi:hypothetical protein